jgi:hypothetical protein
MDATFDAQSTPGAIDDKHSARHCPIPLLEIDGKHSLHFVYCKIWSHVTEMCGIILMILFYARLMLGLLWSVPPPPRALHLGVPCRAARHDALVP